LLVTQIHLFLLFSARQQRRSDGTVPPRPFPHAVYQRKDKNPTAHVPDVPGFSQLTKAEIKRDSKDIEKASQYMV
jgi:hypothetical protein